MVSNPFLACYVLHGLFARYYMVWGDGSGFLQHISLALF